MSDLEFLKELRENVVKGKSDIARHEMALKQIDDWIDELSAVEQSVHTDAPKPFVNHCNPVNGVHAPFCNGDHSARG